jgi:REP element-mobilizing transposase RayT
MARPLRIAYAGASYHVGSRGNDRRPIFESDRDREKFLSLLDRVVRRFGWSISGFVLMTNHFHLVVTTPQPNISKGMQWLNTAYVIWFNRTHGRVGHLLQSRFDARLIEAGTYMAEVLRYIVLNPVRANMVARPEDYRWSSYRATAGLETAPDWLDIPYALSFFGGDENRPLAQANYQDAVLSKIGCEDRLWDKLVNGIFLGSEEWALQMRARVESKPRSSDHPAKQRAVGRPKMLHIINAIGKVSDTPADDIRHKRGGPLRMLAAWMGWNEGLITLRSIAASLRLRSEGHISNLIRRCEELFSANGTLLAHLDAALLMLRPPKLA